MMREPRPGPDRCRLEFDPRARILSFLFFAVAACASSEPRVLASLCLVSFLSMIPSGLTPAEAARRLAPVNLFMILLWLTMPLLAPGPRTRFLGLVDLSLPGIAEALAITLKANAVVAATGAFLSPVEFGALAVGMRRLGAPVKLVWLFILSYRYAVGMADRIGKSVAIIRMRSRKGGGMRFRAYGGLFAKLFVGGHEGGERLYAAMRSRGYGDRLALHRELRWRVRDHVLTGCAAALAGAAIWIGGIA